jgi:hypothetical protein
MLLESQLAEPSNLKGAERAKVEALALKFAEEEKRYNAEKKDVEAEAKKLEAVRDHRRERHPYFEFGEVLLQIAIVSASVAIISTSRQMFWFSLVLAILGAGLAVNGFTPIFTVPFLHRHSPGPRRLGLRRLRERVVQVRRREGIVGSPGQGLSIFRDRLSPLALSGECLARIRGEVQELVRQARREERWRSPPRRPARSREPAIDCATVEARPPVGSAPEAGPRRS